MCIISSGMLAGISGSKYTHTHSLVKDSLPSNRTSTQQTNSIRLKIGVLTANMSFCYFLFPNLILTLFTTKHSLTLK